MTRRIRLLPLLFVLLALFVAPAALAAQSAPASLEAFVGTVSRLWQRGDASGLVDLAASDGSILLDLGGGAPGPVQPRHVAAALRDLFGSRETVSVRPAQVEVAGGSPLQGFGELAWVSRMRGVSDARPQTVYVGAVLERGGWRIRELRLMR